MGLEVVEDYDPTMIADFCRKLLSDDIAPKLTEEEKELVRCMLEDVRDA